MGGSLGRSGSILMLKSTKRLRAIVSPFGFEALVKADKPKRYSCIGR